MKTMQASEFFLKFLKLAHFSLGTKKIKDIIFFAFNFKEKKLRTKIKNNFTVTPKSLRTKLFLTMVKPLKNLRTPTVAPKKVVLIKKMSVFPLINITRGPKK